MKKLSVRDLDMRGGKRVLMRVDYNVPLAPAPATSTMPRACPARSKAAVAWSSTSSQISYLCLRSQMAFICGRV